MAPTPGRRTANHAEIAQELTARPYEWGTVAVYPAAYVVAQIARRIREASGRYHVYGPAGSFETRATPVEDGTLLEARYVRGIARPLRGLIHGTPDTRRDTVEQRPSVTPTGIAMVWPDALSPPASRHRPERNVMTETTNERPPVLDLAQVFGAPAATVLARADEVLLGDVVDSADGPVRVREIVQRLQRWELAGDPPGHPVRYSSSRSTDGLPPLTRVTLPPYARIRVRRTIRSFGRLTGHTKKVVSHNPVKHGWYTHVDGYTAACSCGWTSSTIHAGRTTAGTSWLAHKAGQIAEAAYTNNSALLFIATAEVVHPGLPPVPWRFTSITSGDRKGAGVGQADLSHLPLDQARSVLAAWQAVPGLTTREGSCLDEDLDVPVHTMIGRRRMTADLRLFLDGPHGERLNLTAVYYAPAAPADSGPW